MSYTMTMKIEIDEERPNPFVYRNMESVVDCFDLIESMKHGNIITWAPEFKILELTIKDDDQD